MLRAIAVSPPSQIPLLLLGQGLLGLLFLFSGFLLFRLLSGFLGVPISFLGFVLTLSAFRSFQNLQAYRRRAPHGRAIPPSQQPPPPNSLGELVARLLVTLAEIDGPSTGIERVTAIRLILENFRDRELVEAMNEWRLPRLHDKELIDVLRAMRRGLQERDRVRVFRWCVRVVLSDHRFSSSEHSSLERIAEGLALRADLARHHFLDVKGAILAEREETSRQSGGTSRADPRRAAALAVLELPLGATEDEIRQRHRELVKRYHPDAHAHLGANGVEAATARFREIQKAYEELVRA